MATPTFEEIEVKSVINRVNAPLLPFRWTINPYRGCQHACTYCFARNTHTYLGYDAGKDFNQRIVVKVNAPEVLRRELVVLAGSGSSSPWAPPATRTSPPNSDIS